MKINQLQAKSILIKTKLPASDWVVNPYNGCSFACAYCYAATMARWKYPDEIWGSYVDVKLNAPDLLKQALLKLEKKHQNKDFGTIFFSSVCDPYQAAEVKFQLTKKCLEVLQNFGYQGEVSILTKSSLITRDIDVLKKLKNKR